MAFNLLLAGTGFDVVMLDRRPEMVRSHVLDLEQVLDRALTGRCGKAPMTTSRKPTSWS